MNYEPGIYDGMGEADYRKAAGVSQSTLKPIERSPAHFKAGVEDAEDREETSALTIGRIGGALFLEPDRDAWWTVKPDDVAFNNKEGRQWAMDLCGWVEEKDGKFPRKVDETVASRGITLISANDFKIASRIATALSESKKPEVRELLDGAKHEVSVFANLETDNGTVLCKSRPDIVSGNALGDLKTCIDARQFQFKKSVEKYGYDIQAASYLKQWNTVCKEGDEKHHFYLLAVEKTNPYAMIVHKLDSDWIKTARDRYMQMLNRFAFCSKFDDWPDYEPGVNVLTPSKWNQPEIL